MSTTAANNTIKNKITKFSDLQRNLLPILLTALKNLSQHNLAKTCLCYYLIGYSVQFFLHAGMGKISVVFTLFLHNAFLYLIYTELKLIMDIFPEFKRKIFLIKISNFITKLKTNSELYQMVVRSYYLGLTLAWGKFLYKSEIINHWQNLGCFIVILSLFHFGEFFFTALSNPQNLSVKSFILNHSREYHLAMGIGVLEYILMSFLWPKSTAQLSYLNILGILMCLVGEFIRKLSMLTLGTNFNHIIEFEDRDEKFYKQHNMKYYKHNLVTSGIYSHLRHPSYSGWALWSIGSQLVLGNVFCFVLYGIATFKFFEERIPEEEKTLKNKFGKEWDEYVRKTPFSGIPGVN